MAGNLGFEPRLRGLESLVLAVTLISYVLVEQESCYITVTRNIGIEPTRTDFRQYFTY